MKPTLIVLNNAQQNKQITKKVGNRRKRSGKEWKCKEKVKTAVSLLYNKTISKLFCFQPMHELSEADILQLDYEGR